MFLYKRVSTTCSHRTQLLSEVEFSKNGHIILHPHPQCELAIPLSSGGVRFSTPVAWKDSMPALTNIIW